jgi:hypothetical protein
MEVVEVLAGAVSRELEELAKVTITPSPLRF